MVARKAVRTRQFRNDFRHYFGDETVSVVRMLCQGMTSHEVSDELCVPVTSVAAYKANLTRGTYYPFAKMVNEKVYGGCKF